MENNKIRELVKSMRLIKELEEGEILGHEDQVAQKILDILIDSNITVVRATEILNFCKNAIQFTKM